MLTPKEPRPQRRQARSISVPKSTGEQVKRRLDALGIRDLSLKIRLSGKNLLIPLKPGTDLMIVRKTLKNSHLDITESRFNVYSSKPLTKLKNLLTNLSSSKIKQIPRAFDIVGGIAIIELPPELEEDSQQIGEALLTLHQRLKSVYTKTGPVVGDFRLRELRLIAGEDKAETIHRENGCLFKVNLAETFFNPRLGGERKRVANQVLSKERVLDMFAGVGPFSVLIAKLTHAKVYAVDLNPEAVKYLRENVQLNHVEDRVEIIEGDAAKLPSKLNGKIDRVIMNLPERSADFLDVACRALRPRGGIIHFYSFQHEPEEVKKAETLLLSNVERYGRTVAKIQLARSLREIAPRTYQVVIDARIGKLRR